MEVKKGVGGFTVFSHVAPKKRVFFIFRFLLFSPQAWAREAPTNRSTSAMVNPLAILYGSETGTAQVRQKKAKLSAGLSYFLLVPTERLHRGAHPRRSVSGAPHNSEADCISHAQKKYPRLSLSVVDSLRLRRPAPLHWIGRPVSYKLYIPLGRECGGDFHSAVHLATLSGGSRVCGRHGQTARVRRSCRGAGLRPYPTSAGEPPGGVRRQHHGGRRGAEQHVHLLAVSPAKVVYGARDSGFRKKSCSLLCKSVRPTPAAPRLEVLKIVRQPPPPAKVGGMPTIPETRVPALLRSP